MLRFHLTIFQPHEFKRFSKLTIFQLQCFVNHKWHGPQWCVHGICHSIASPITRKSNIIFGARQEYATKDTLRSPNTTTNQSLSYALHTQMRCVQKKSWQGTFANKDAKVGITPRRLELSSLHSTPHNTTRDAAFVVVTSSSYLETWQQRTNARACEAGRGAQNLSVCVVVSCACHGAGFVFLTQQKGTRKS